MKTKLLSYAGLTLLALSTIAPAFAADPAPAGKASATNKVCAAGKSSCKSAKRHAKVKTVKETK